MGRVLFAFATQREVAPFAARLGSALELGVGKAAAAAALARELARGGIETVVLLGIAGAYDREVSIGSLRVVGESVFGDEGVVAETGFTSVAELGFADAAPFVHAPELAARAAEAIGAGVVRSATVSTCSGTDAAARAVAARTGAGIETMESAAVALACAGAGVDLLELRAISNYCGDRTRGAWDVDAAVEALGRAVDRLLVSGVLDGDLEFGLSPCPNDTFAFHAWIAGLVVGAPTVEPWFADIEALNRRAIDDPLPVTKVSAASLPAIVDRYRVATAGAALGRGCGPLVLVRQDSGVRTLVELAGRRVAMPGDRTTAARLFRTFGPEVEFVETRFDRIEAAVAAGACDAGLVIHESRFTYERHGLRAVADLGDVWERETGMPLPLGVIAIRRDVAAAAHVSAAIRRSVEAARELPARSRAFVREHAQEMDEDVCARHIELYVNDYSVELGADGRAAVERLVGCPIDWVPASP